MSVTILDGGLGQELIKRAGKATGLWSTQALLDAPDTVRAVHLDFLNAGAEIVTADTYALLPDRLVTFGIEDQMETLMATALRLVNEARDKAGHGKVAGSMGPLGFSYRPDLAPPAAEAAEAYAKLAAMQAPLVDMILLETMAGVNQARGALMGASVVDVPVWLCLSVDDQDGTLLRSGEKLTEIAPLLAEFAPERVMINCSVPEAVSQAMPVIAGFGLPCGGYANGFTQIASNFDSIGATVDVLTTRQDVGPERYADFAQDWVAAGATAVGGCCEIGPDHIAALVRRFKPEQAAAPAAHATV